MAQPNARAWMVWTLAALAVTVGSYGVVAGRAHAVRPARPEALAPTSPVRAQGLESGGLGVTTEYHIERPMSRLTVESGSLSGEHATARITEESGKSHVISSSREPDMSAESLGVPVPPGAERSGARRLDSATGLLAAFPGAKGVAYEVPRGVESVVAFYRDHPSHRFSVVESTLVEEAGLRVVEVSDRPTVLIGIEGDAEGGAQIVLLDISEPAAHGSLGTEDLGGETNR